jgi:hypothetical protein
MAVVYAAGMNIGGAVDLGFDSGSNELGEA